MLMMKIFHFRFVDYQAAKVMSQEQARNPMHLWKDSSKRIYLMHDTDFIQIHSLDASCRIQCQACLLVSFIFFSLARYSNLRSMFSCVFFVSSLCFPHVFPPATNLL